MRPTRDSGIVTVAALRERESDGALECLFNEREQIFTLSPAVKAQAASAERLRGALERNEPLRATFDLRKEVLTRAEPLPERALRDFERTRTMLENPDKPVRVDVRRIDPTVFNIVDYHLKFPTFRLCNRIIPSYGVARDIFDYCAAQSCHLPGPPAVTPCISFQYVRDGCYARAHKMRRIIEEQYGYCCEKVFSFANQGNDRLAVRADKWGGCCVTWWYHVAPLVRVRVRLRLGWLNLQFVLAMVIDPGMFDKPVLLSTWLGAQEHVPCWPTANVSMYSIQPGSAYSPANYGGTAFATDPTYTDTDATLTGYANATTCP
jgi:hypothetical protein